MYFNCSIGSVTQVGHLFAVGSTSLLAPEVSRVSVAGARAIDQGSSLWLKQMINGLAPGTAVVSGLALGADTIAFKSALSRGLPCIAVLPSGFDNITPKTNIQLARDIVKSGGLLISEYAPNAQATPATYVARNSIIAQLGKFLIVPQFEQKSGTRHTVDFAQKEGKLIVVQNQPYSGNSFILQNSKYKTIAK